MTEPTAEERRADYASWMRGATLPGELLERPPLLTDEEHALVEILGQWYGRLCDVAGHGPTRDADLNEACIHIHALQGMVLRQAAARAFPFRYRLIGERVIPCLHETIIRGRCWLCGGLV